MKWITQRIRGASRSARSAWNRLSPWTRLQISRIAWTFVQAAAAYVTTVEVWDTSQITAIINSGLVAVYALLSAVVREWAEARRETPLDLP